MSYQMAPYQMASAPENNRPPAVVLAGGQGRRMGGYDKPLLRLAGRPLLDHVLARLRPQVGDVALNANGDPARFAAWDLPVLADPVADLPGPLAGVVAAMLWARERGLRVLTVPGDVPLLPLDLVARLAATDPGRIALARADGRLHPTLALWPVALADTLLAALRADQRRVAAWAVEQRAVCVDFTDAAAFHNVNTPADLAVAESLLMDR